jgi:ABC-2 type transport system ATP-binding protein
VTKTATYGVEAKGLSMTYRAPVRDPGLGAAVASLFRRRYREVHAVKGVSFTISPGEIVGFLGPNGAGKTTTLKMLCGVLHPTAGTATVLGRTPWRRDHDFLRSVALIRGSKPLQEVEELTVMDVLRFQGLVYDVPPADFDRNVDELADLLALDPILERQVRALSLGERMRAGLANALVYRPRVLFLDEPTLGLDVTATTLVRQFFAAYAERTNATVLLTSHYMADVAELCSRVVLIDGGVIQYDGDLPSLRASLAPWKLVTLSVDGASDGRSPVDWSRFGDVVGQEDGTVTLRVGRSETASVTAALLAEASLVDLSVQDPPLEAVMDTFYRREQLAEEAV